MILYHGSNVEIEAIDLSRSKPGKDFGRGFYLNPDRAQALLMAQRTAKALGEGEPIVTPFLFDERLLSTGEMAVKIFSDYSEEWAHFVLSNRRNGSSSPVHHYDIVVGPIADDTVGLQLRLYSRGYIDIPTLVRQLSFKGSRAVQYFFANAKAIATLKKIEP